jgi:uncharacterized membrane protein
MRPVSRGERRAGVLPGVLLGIGVGGLVDGIVLHQILQWHHMLSAEGGYPVTTVAGLETNTLADGVFHAAAMVAVLVGVWMLWRAAARGRPSVTRRFLAGSVLMGWGLFNGVEGVIDHQILGLHHVRDDLGGPLSWDIGFLVVSGALATAGWVVARSASHRAAR